MKLVVQKYDDEVQNWVPARDQVGDDISRCLVRPNSYSTSGEFLGTTLTNLLKDGNALITTQKNEAADYKYLFEVMHTDGVRPVLHPKTLVKGYWVSKTGFNLTGKYRKFVPINKMIHVRIPNSEHLEWGISYLESAEHVQDGETMAMAWNKNLMSNSGSTSFVLTTQEPLNKAQRSAIRNAIMEDSAAQYAGYPLLLTHGIKPAALGRSPVELDYIESSRLDLIRICALLNVPPSLIDPAVGATQASRSVLQRSFLTTAVLPLVGHICETMTQHWLVKEVGGTSYRIWYDASGAAELRESVDKIQMIELLYNKGVTLNEINASLELGLPYLPTGNIRIINGVVIDWAGIEPVYHTNANPHNLGDARDQGTTGILSEGNDPGEARLPTANPAQKSLSKNDIDNIWQNVERDRNFLISVHKARVEEAVNSVYRNVLSESPINFYEGSSVLQSLKEKNVEILRRTLDRIWFETVTIFKEGFGATYDVPRKFRKSLSNEEQQEATEMAALRAEQISDTVSHWLIGIVAEMMLEGLSEPEMVERLRDLLPGVSEFKAAVIVENEVLAASNLGNRIGAIESGTYTLKVWRTQRDNKVRASHVGMEGETTLLSSLYSNGLRFPCDPLGPARETVNCRCFETYE